MLLFTCLGVFVLKIMLLQVPYVTIALTDSKLGAEGRKDLFDWLSRQLSGLSSFSEAAQLLKPASTAMTVISASCSDTSCHTSIAFLQFMIPYA